MTTAPATVARDETATRPLSRMTMNADISQVQNTASISQRPMSLATTIRNSVGARIAAAQTYRCFRVGKITR